MAGPNGDYVYVIGPDDTVQRRTVQVASRQDGLAVIAKGLAAGEQVVVGGQYRLANNVKVEIETTPRTPRPATARPADRRMSISEVFIRRPIATALLMVGILVFGMATFTLLPVAALPNVDFPTIVVSATLPGASPQTMAASVATPLEQQFAAIPGLDADVVHQRAGHDARSRCSSTWRATSTARPRTCRPRSTPPAGCCRRPCPRRRPSRRPIRRTGRS